jgi:hypothetical protein
MAYVKIVTALALIKALNEGQSIYNTGNRTYDSDARAGASSVDIDAMPLLVAKSTGSSSTDADRLGPGDTTKVNVPLVPTIVPVKAKKIDEYSTNGRMMKDFIEGARDAMTDKFDNDFVDAIQDGATVTPAGVLTWEVLTEMDTRMTINKVPRRNRFCVIDAQLEGDFLALDIVKQAMAFNPNYLENGIMKVKGVNYIISAVAPELNGNPTLNQYYGPGVAFILNQFMDAERVYDGTNVQVNYDYIAYSGAKLLKCAFGEVVEITG